MAHIETRKDGMAIVPTDNTPVNLSIQLLDFIAERHPNGIPTKAAHPRPVKANVKVKGNCSDNVSVTLLPEKTSEPKSPCKTFPIKIKN